MLRLLLAFGLASGAWAQAPGDSVTLPVTGSGASVEAATQDALRSAVQQAFGAFISSRTEILNDRLVRDEIVSVASGNIQQYEATSEARLPDGTWTVSLRATVSIGKLTTFVESKGVAVEFKGGLFGQNIRRQQLNERGEIQAVTELCRTLRPLADSAFDFGITAGEPHQWRKVRDQWYTPAREQWAARSEVERAGSGERPGHARPAALPEWQVPLRITARANANLETASDHLLRTLRGLSLTAAEAENYRQLGKEVYPLAVASTSGEWALVRLRRPESVEMVLRHVFDYNRALTNFTISDNLRARVIQDFPPGEVYVYDAPFRLILRNDPDQRRNNQDLNRYYTRQGVFYRHGETCEMGREPDPAEAHAGAGFTSCHFDAVLDARAWPKPPLTKGGQPVRQFNQGPLGSRETGLPFEDFLIEFQAGGGRASAPSNAGRGSGPEGNSASLQGQFAFARELAGPDLDFVGFVISFAGIAKGQTVVEFFCHDLRPLEQLEKIEGYRVRGGREPAEDIGKESR